MPPECCWYAGKCNSDMILGDLCLRQSTLIAGANVLFLSQIFALLFVRGKPYSGQDIVSELLGRDGGCGWLWLGPLTSFSWNIIVPVGLLVLSISSFKSGHYREVSGSILYHVFVTFTHLTDEEIRSYIGNISGFHYLTYNNMNSHCDLTHGYTVIHTCDGKDYYCISFLR